MIRPCLAMFEELQEADRNMVRVVLAAGAEMIDGRAELRDEISRPFALAEATLAAAAGYAGIESGFKLIESRVVDLVTGDVAVVTCFTDTSPAELMAGVAPIRADGWEKAVCRASLDAVNRIIVRD